VSLTPNQKIFADEYLIDLNATRAYKHAYKNVKKDETAAVNGSRLLRNAKVKEYIEEKMRAREKRTEITQDQVLRELAKIAFADIKDYLSFRTAKTVVEHDKETGEPIIDYSQVIEMRDSDDVDGSLIQEVSLNAKGVFTFKLYDKLAALDKLGKHLGMFTDKVEISGQVNNPMEGLTTEELKKLIYDEEDI
jgi:phage terminase small subunit